MKLVAVSQRVNEIPERGEIRDALDERMVAFLLAVGVLPLPVPNGLGPQLAAWLAAVHPHAIVLSGGNDIGSFPNRDRTEGVLLTYAQSYRLPLLAICRGMQMLGHWAGVSLQPVAGHVGTRHRVHGTFSGEVNSFHRFALSACPPGFEVVARSEDGAIEAIRHLSLPWQGWMWHPEREREFTPRDLEQARRLLR